MSDDDELDELVESFERELRLGDDSLVEAELLLLNTGVDKEIIVSF